MFDQPQDRKTDQSTNWYEGYLHQSFFPYFEKVLGHTSILNQWYFRVY